MGIFTLSASKAHKIEDKLDLGEKYLEELKYEKAIATYKEVLKIDPKNLEAYLGIADAYVAMGEYEEALEILEEGYEETESRKIEEKIEVVEVLLSNGDLSIEHVDNTPSTPSATPEPTPEPDFEDYAIDWIDPNLEAAMREVTGIYDRDIMYSDVKDITE